MSRRPLPSELILFVTSRCPLRCKHCFNWKNLQRDSDLSLAEIEELARSLPTLKSLMISGGEPFLRKDLARICSAFVRESGVRSIDIPTSGALAAQTAAAVEEILEREPSLRLSVGISFDGMQPYHDENRGVAGTFDRAVDCCQRLLELKRRSRRLSVSILTTLVGGNREELARLKEFAAAAFPDLDHLYWGVARGDAKEKELCSIPLEDVAAVDRELIAFEAARQGEQRRPLNERFYELRRQALSTNRQPVPCMAGRSIAVVYDDGGVAPCELLPAVGNLRERSFETIWNGREMEGALHGIGAGKCACSHECFLYPSFEADLRKRPLELLKLKGLNGLLELLYTGSGTIRNAADRLRNKKGGSAPRGRRS